MKILSPMQDSAIWRMHADLCLAQVKGTSDPCNSYGALGAALSGSSWLAAFAWVALWRCAWVLSIWYIISCCGSLAVKSVYLWDRFSDWFFGFRVEAQLA